MEIEVQQLVQKYPSLLTHHSGPINNSIRRVVDPRSAKGGDLVFVSNPNYLEQALNSQASVIVAETSLAGSLPTTDKTILISPNGQLVMARVLKDLVPNPFGPPSFDGHRIHPTAVIAQGAVIHETASVGPHAVIETEVQIGAHSRIGAQCFIGARTSIGKNCHLHSQVVVEHDCVLEDEVELQPHCSIGAEGFGYAHDAQGRHERITHMGRAILRRGVHLGAGCRVARGTFQDTEIGEGTKIDNEVHFAHNVRVGKHCLFAAGTLVAGSTTIGNYVVVGGGCRITGHIEIVDFVKLGGTSNVSKSVLKKGDYQGYPLQPILEHKRVLASMINLPSFRKEFLDLVKNLKMRD